MPALPLLLALAAQASATGVMNPPVYQLLGAGCALAEDGPRDSGAPLRFVGYGSGFTSPPGGPGTTHIWPVGPDALSLRRPTCEQAEPGGWVETGESCGPAPVLEWRGRLRPGAAYQLSVDGSDGVAISIAGTADPEPCPVGVAGPRPPAPRVQLSRTTRALELPPGAVTVADGHTRVSPAAVALAIGTPDLQGGVASPGEVVLAPDGAITAEATVTRRWTRTPATSESGAAQCVVGQSDTIELTFPGSPVRFELSGELPQQVAFSACAD